MDRSSEFDRMKHVAFLEMMMEWMPSPYESQEINRLTLAYFTISGLAILDALDSVDKDRIINWVLSLQAHPRDRAELENGQLYGFHGSRSSQFHRHDAKDSVPNGSHLASTYCALAILRIIGYDLSSIDSESILISMRHLQQPDGSFTPIHLGAEMDLRFVYCAGGGTFCAVAALRLMGFVEADALSKSPVATTINVPLLLEWCMQRQGVDGGFQGRVNKASDTCYAFWVGGVLKILGAYLFLDKDALRRFLLSCESQYSGFKKFPEDVMPDLYHSYYGLAALSLLEEPGLIPLCVELGIPTKDAI